MNILFLRGFNNYFNRIVKKYNSLDDYKSNSIDYLDFGGINFNPNDGVITELVLGNETQTDRDHGTPVPLDFEVFGSPDYAVCYEGANIIKSRWFILECERTRYGQYRIALKRDIIAEHFNQIMNAPCFVEKGNIRENSDPAIFNNEEMSFNQIKQSEILLKDNSQCGWIVGYVSQDKTRYPSTGYYESTSPVATYEDYADVPAEIKRLAGIGVFQRPVAKIGTSWGVPAGRCKMTVHWNCLKSPMQYQDISLSNVPWTGEISYTNPSTTAPSGGYLYAAWGGEQVINSNTIPGTGCVSLMEAIRFSTLRDAYVQNILSNGEDFDDATQNLIESWNGRYFKNGTKVYQIKYEVVRNRYMGPSTTIKPGTQAYDELVDVFNTWSSGATGTFFSGNSSNISSSVMRINGGAVGQNFANLAWEVYDASVTFIEVQADAGDKIKTYIPANRIQACDTPMDIFAIPYSDNFKIYTEIDEETGDIDPTSLITMSKQVALQAAISLAQAGNNVYDIQILPYFPNPSMISKLDPLEYEYDLEGYILNNSWVNTGLYTEDIHFNYFYNTTDTPIGIIFWSRTSTFSVDINESITLDSSNPLELKVSNECDLYRLTSPNYSGSFEFSLAKSGGRITKFNADCTYKPYSPYIHVTPDLSGLYGENFSSIDDARGLICGGDFSIAKIVSNWEQYEMQNKNYQAIFDRQIQNMDVNNQIAKEQLNWRVFAGYFGGGIGGAAGGAMAGAKLGGGYGAIAGAVGGAYMGTVGSIIGGEMDKEWLARQQAEAKNYTSDMYGYQLGNIKALPYALSKTSAQTNNNKIFPFVEFFSATEIEKEALRSKIGYNGMTIMRIGKLNDYATSDYFDNVYVKGQLIRLDNINDDFHIADAIYKEVQKGFFIPQEGN